MSQDPAFVRTLAIGTSSPALSVALFEDTRLIAHEHRLIGRGHAEAVVPAVAALPGQGKAAAIVVDIGPGSFTGIRVGIASARALGLAWGVPVYGVSAVHLVAAAAFAARPDCAALTVLLDAGRGQLLRQSVMADYSTSALDVIGPDQISGLDIFLAGAGVQLLAEAGAHCLLHAEQPDVAALFHVPAFVRQRLPAAIYARPLDAVLPL